MGIAGPPINSGINIRGKRARISKPAVNGLIIENVRIDIPLMQRNDPTKSPILLTTSFSTHSFR